MIMLLVLLSCIVSQLWYLEDEEDHLTSMILLSVKQKVNEKLGLHPNKSIKLTYTIQFLTDFFKELTTRFENCNIDVLKGISACTLYSSNFLSIEDLQSFCKMYGVRVF